MLSFLSPKEHIKSMSLITLFIATLTILTSTKCNLHAAADTFIDASKLKPSIILIVPQTFKIPLQTDTDYPNRLQQYVAVINNAQNDREDALLRRQYKKLTLQVRDAKSPVTGQLFYEHVFDYFPSDIKSQHLLIPIDLDQVSTTQDHIPRLKNFSSAASAAVSSRPTQLIVSIRPYQLDQGYGSESIELVSSAPVLVERILSADGQRSFAIVQTDKPIYKPNEKVRIRALIVNENFRPVLRDEFKIQIRNPQKLVVEEKRFPTAYSEQQQQKPDGSEQLFMDHDFEFPPEPMLGSWSVHLLHSDPIANDTTSFEVKEYVLPPFEIEFESSRYILPTTQNITGAIVVKYHYGKPVQGKAQFKFGYRESNSVRPTYVARSSIKNIDPNTGRVEYRIGSDKFKETGWFPSIAGSYFVVEVTVTEMTTGHQETALDSSTTFLKMPYKVIFDETIEDFKPGLSQLLSVQFIEMQTLRPAPSGKKVIAEYRNQNNSVLNLHAIINKSTDGNSRLELESVTDASGRATFRIGPVSDEVTSILVTIKLINSTMETQSNPLEQLRSHEESFSRELAVGHHTLVRHDSHNGYVSLMNKTVTSVKVGENFISDILIRDAIVVPQKIYYILVSKGQIISLNNLNADGLVSFEVIEQMIPSVRVVLFAITHDSVGLLSDSMRVNVEQKLDCNLNLRYVSDSTSKDSTLIRTHRPNDKGKLEIQARPGDQVSLIGTDSAVYSLNKRNRPDSSRLMQRIKRLDSGCGFGGGKNNLDVFHNAGLMFFKDILEIDPDDAIQTHVGTSCLTLINQLKYLEDVQMGYVRPVLSLLTRPKSLEMAAAFRQRVSSVRAGSHHLHKRDVEVDAVLRKYDDPLDKSCCRLGTMEDLPQRRNCSARARIVEKYMHRTEFKSCSRIYYECCKALYSEHISLGSMVIPQDQSELIVEPRIVRANQPPLYAEHAHFLNVGHLDKIEAQTLIRKDFRETWLFDIVDMGPKNDKTSIDVRLPHSITLWSISAISLNRYKPMCFMAEPLRLTTFQEVFIQVSMPFKVIQGEQIDLVTTVFNYSPKIQDVLVYMYGVENVCSEAEPGERSDRKRIRIEKHSSQSILFPMIPLKTGKYQIKILAITIDSNSSDIVERTLNVVPRGKPVTDETTISLDPMNHQRRSKRAIHTGNLVDEIDPSRGLQRSKVRLIPTRDSEFIVPNTQECIVSAIGDKMGQSTQTAMLDVENLIRLPHGCGEQVMIYLGPTLYTTRYLSATNKLSGDLRWRAIRYIQSGYKRILNFRKDDGSFSAFARREPSIWLTAFIVKLLCQTERTQLIESQVHIDKTVINSALKWLINSQNNETGTWVELNPVYHREMLGGVLKENALTAFITVTLNECSHHSPDVIDETKLASFDREPVGMYHQQTDSIDKLKVATKRAEESLLIDRYKAVRERNPYVLALTSYALSFSRPREAILILNDLMLFAERSQSRNHLSWRGDYPIETAAYALQALIELAPLITSKSTGTSGSWQPGSDAIAISNWLSSRRSYTGAFESTQDTVVALEALSKYSLLQSSPNGNSLIPQPLNPQPNLMCNVTMSNRSRRSIEFGSNNAQILQTFKLDSGELDLIRGDMLDIVTSGNGLGTMSVRLKYNVFQEDDELCRFNIDSSIEEWKPKLSFSSTSKQTGQSMDDKMKEVNDNQTNEGIEDDYFKTFDKSMLNELNLIDLNQPSPEGVLQKRSQLPSPIPANPVLRLGRVRRLASSDHNEHDDSHDTSWTTKLVSSIKAKLPSWLVPKLATTSETTTPTLSLPKSPTPISSEVFIDPFNETKFNDLRRNNTSRRSAQNTPVPIVIQPPGFPIGQKLNTLSDQLDIGRNTTNLTTANYKNSSNIPQRLVLLLRVCVHHMSSRRDSEMSVIEIGILSGFKPNEADLKEIINDVGTPAMKYEMSADKSLVVIYMHYVPFSGPYCMQFRIVRDSLVYNVQSGYIRVYEYYSPTHSCSNFYTPARISDLIETKCDSSGQVCECASKSLCPATNKLMDLSEVYSVNATSARNQLIDLTCSNRFDFVSLVRLKVVRHLEVGKMFRLSVKVKADIKGNLTQIIEAQRQQKGQINNGVRKPQHSPVSLGDLRSLAHEADIDDEEDVSLDHLNLSIDSSCVRDDPLLLHLAHPNQWKQGGELMILFGRYSSLEKKHFKVSTKTSSTLRGVSRTTPSIGPRPMPSVYSSNDANKQQDNLLNMFDDGQQLQYSTTMLLDKNSILHDVTYQPKVGPRESINNLILWLELRSRREKWTCPQAVN